MNKTELLNAISNSPETEGITKKDIESVVNTYQDEIVKSLLEGESVKIKGFGNFEVKETAARIGRNPQSGVPVDIPAGRKATWKPADAIKSALNE